MAGWMASLTWWTWVWVNSLSWWWTGRPGVLRFMGSQRVRHDWATELNWCCRNVSMSEAFSVSFQCIKLSHKNPEWSSLVPDLEAKSLEITNLTYFTISYFLWDPQDWIKTIINSLLNFSSSPSLHTLEPKHSLAFPLTLRIFLSIPFSGEMNKDFPSILSSWWTKIHQKSAEEEGKIL